MKPAARSLPPSPLQRLRRPRAGMAGWLLAVLLAMQVLGLVHTVAHAARHVPVAGLGDAATSPRDGGAFGAHEAGSADCQLYDQLAHGDLALACDNPWGPQRVAAVAPAAVALLPRPSAVRRYCARDPPAALA